MGNVVIKSVGKGKYAIKGTCQWAKVHTPDTRFNELGVYSIDIDLPTEEDQELVRETLLPIAQEAFDEAVKEKPALKKQLTLRDMVKVRYDEDGEEIGHYIQIKQQAKAYSKKKEQWYEFPPKVTDAQGNIMSKDQLVGNGSEVVVLFEPNSYVMPSDKSYGVSLKGLRQVKVLSLVEYGGGVDELAEFEGDFVTDKPATSSNESKSSVEASDSIDDEDWDDDVPF